MNIFICHHDGTEHGPYSWVDIYVMLNTGDLSEDAIARIDAETKSIADWNHWNEGTDVGPLTWDEVSTMLQAGALDLDVQAKFEGTAELSRLQDVISQSQEVHFPDETEEKSNPSNLAERTHRAIQHAFALPQIRIGVAATALLILSVGIYFGIFGGAHKPKSNETNTVAPMAAPASLAASRPEQETVATSNTNLPPAPAPEETPDKGVVAAEPPRPTLPPLEEAPGTPAASPRPSPPPEHITLDSDSEEHLSEENAKGDAHTPPTSNPPKPTPEPLPPLLSESPPAPAPPQQALDRAQAPTPPAPTPIPRPTPQTTVATSLRDFFEIQSIKFLKKEPKDGIGVWLFAESEGPTKTLLPDVFQPCLQVEVLANGNIYSKKLTAKAYFFDRNNKLIASVLKPSKVGTKSQRTHFDMPVLFHKEQPTDIFFEIPETIRSQKWTAVIVFGDKDEAQSACYPHTSRDFLLNYPEKELVYDRTTVRPARKSVMDPLIEYVVKTKNPKHPQITLFLRPPKGIDDWSEVQGVYALVVLANSVDDIRRRMQAIELDGDEAGSFAFANKHKLAILMWGARSIWDARRNFDDYERREARELDRNFDMVANAWEEAIQHFHHEYGTPTNNFILQGSCGAAQWAKRLCLRKPDYFLAAHIHLAGSYDKPTPEASKVLWCVTTTEQDGGYERSLEFLTACREMGYPIMYKAATPQSAIGSLGYQFFEYALTLKGKRKEYDREMSNALRQPNNNNDKTPRPWIEAFAEPPFYGDVVNQEEFSAKDVEQIPNAFRSAIPTKQLADIWKSQ